MIRSGFFNSMNGDRKYDASKFAEYFASFIGNGVFPDSLQVVSNNNMTVTVKTGKAWINGYIMINDADYILNINAADGVLNRIDRIVLRYDVIDREIRLEVKQGTFAASPIAPALQRDADAYELCLADITVSAGAVSLTQDRILDTRYDSILCGKVDTLIAGDFLSLSEAVNNKLDKVADSKDLTVTFTEASADADIASGDTHSTLFGKILKNLNTLRESIYNIVNGGTTVGKAVTLNGLLSSIAELNFVKGVTSAIQTQLNGKAPTSHASSGTGYGIGTTSNYGHCKVRNDLSASAYVDGEALSAYQGTLIVPIGAVIMWAKNSVPAGYLECNGAAISRTTYSKLYSIIGTVFGSGDGSTTFNLPDLRGQFVRGFDNGRGLDAGRVFGSAQESTALASYWNQANGSELVIKNDDGEDGTSTTLTQINTKSNYPVCNFKKLRPTNVALKYCIKY